MDAEARRYATISVNPRHALQNETRNKYEQIECEVALDLKYKRSTCHLKAPFLCRADMDELRSGNVHIREMSATVGLKDIVV